jgi:bifunctional DNase/RNase
LLSVIGNLKGSIDSVVISDLKNDVFYGEIIINVAQERIEVDCRPSDAVALAVRAEVPIFAEDKVLDIAGITIESTKDKTEPQEKKKTITEEELKRLSAFTDFVEELNMENFGEDKPKGQ